MYDISQLNEMLIPELQDIADQLSIPHAEKTEKQDLIYKILDRQARVESETTTPAPEKNKRKRIVKANTSNTTEQAATMTATAPENRDGDADGDGIAAKESFKIAVPKKGTQTKN